MRGVFVLLVLLCTQNTAEAGTYQTRPFFQTPTSCAQMWRAASYDGHGNSLDLNQWDVGAGSTVQDEGNFVRAAAGGTVVQAYTVNSPDSKHHGARRLRIDHDNGWKTYYTHMRDSVSHLLNERVAQGEVIGITGTTGNSNGPHIHTNQEGLDSDSGSYDNMRHTYNGVYSSVHGGNFGATELLLSNNCGGERFMAWSEGTRDFMLIYKPQSGSVKIVEVDSDGKGTTTRYSSTWSLQYTHMEAYKVSGVQYAVLYKARTGFVNFIRLTAGGAGYSNVVTGTWGTGWTHIVPFQNGNTAYLLVYSSLHGHANWERVNAGNVYTTNLHASNWVRGRTVLMPYWKSGVQYLLLYRGGSGDVKTVSVSFAWGSVSTQLVWTATWTGGWTHMVDFNVGGLSYMLAYKQETGTAKILKYGATGVTTTYSSTWSKPWTHITPFYIGSTGHVLMYKTGTGYMQTMRIANGGTGYTKLWGATWTSGWN